MVYMIEGTSRLVDGRKNSEYICGYCDKQFTARTDYKERKSCGCYQKIVTTARLTTHNGTGTLTHASWDGMKSRCLTKSNSSYPRYGGAGITICDRWMNFENFLEDMGPRPSKEHTIDRIDNSRGYEPSNCRWADRLTQATNKEVGKGKLGYQGVVASGPNFRVCIYVNKKRIELKTHKTIKECVEVRNKYIVDNNLPHKLQEYKDE